MRYKALNVHFFHLEGFQVFKEQQKVDDKVDEKNIANTWAYMACFVFIIMCCVSL